MNAPDDMQVDHVDGNGLDCRRKKNGKWVSDIWVNGKKIYLGTFVSIEDAAQAYAAASDKYHGKFGRLG